MGGHAPLKTGATAPLKTLGPLARWEKWGRGAEENYLLGAAGTIF